MQIFLFPGQGSQYIGMGKDLYNNFGSVRSRFEEASDSLSIDIKKIIFDSTEKDLSITYNSQPSILLISIAMMDILKNEFGIIIDKKQILAGHSLGEYTALTEASVWAPFDAYKIVYERGKAMQNAIPLGISKMVAIIGCNILDAQNNLEKDCFIANDNSDGQIVISGLNDPVDKTLERLKPYIKKAIPLNVSAPFHSPLMQDTVPIMKDVLLSFKKNNLQSKVTSNVTTKEFNDENIFELLLKQLVERVRWREQILEINSNYPDATFIEVGPKQVLGGLVKRIVKDPKTKHFEDFVKLT